SPWARTDWCWAHPMADGRGRNSPRSAKQIFWAYGNRALELSLWVFAAPTPVMTAARPGSPWCEATSKRDGIRRLPRPHRGTSPFLSVTEEEFWNWMSEPLERFGIDVDP